MPIVFWLVLWLAACSTDDASSSDMQSPSQDGNAGDTGSSPAGAGAGAGAAGAAGGEAGGGAAGMSARGDAGPGAGGDAGGEPAAGDAGEPAAPDAGAEPDAQALWSPLTVMAVVDPIDHGARGDGAGDDLAALAAAVDALPAAGGIVYLPEQTSFKKIGLLVIGKDHVKFWAPNRQAELFQSTAGQARMQSTLCRDNEGCGFFGVKLRSDAGARQTALEDNQISADHSTLVEVVGCEIEGSAAVGVMLYGTTESYVEGNYIHHTWADHIHHTEGARSSWVWDNFLFNESPSRGDDGVACVTYGVDNPRCRDMEWWANVILHTDWGRGYSVIGGDDIFIHHNWAIEVAGAGVIVASESSYDTASSSGITIASNYVYRSGHAIGHPGILVSGLHDAAEPIDGVTLTDNASVDNQNGAYRAEGMYTNVSNQGLATARDALPDPIPTRDDVRMADTSVLRTRDVSHVAAELRHGLHRIHVRRSADGAFEQRFEYVVKGAPAAVDAWVAAIAASGVHVSEQRTVAGDSYALVLAAEPLAVPDELAAVPFPELRAGDLRGDLGWLWQRLASGVY